MTPAQQFLCDWIDELSMPEVYQRVRALTTDTEAGIDSYTEVIQDDAMLTERVIRIANSSYFGYLRKVQDLYQAISLIGVIQLQDLLLCNLCMRAFSSIPNSLIDMQRFWSCGIGCGIAARKLAVQMNIPAGARFFSLGLLHEVGHAVMFLKAPDAAVRAISESQTTAASLVKLEQKYLGFDYAELGEMVMRAWHLPDVYSQTARHHLQPECAEEAFRLPAAIVGLAHFLSQDPDASDFDFSVSGAASILGKEIASVDKLKSAVLADIEQHTPEVMMTLRPNHSLTVW